MPSDFLLGLANFQHKVGRWKENGAGIFSVGFLPDCQGFAAEVTAPVR